MQQAVGSILKVLAYFDLFNYPVSSAEIGWFADIETDENTLRDALNNLTAEGCVFRFKDLYSLRDDQELAERRIRGNERACNLLKIAERTSAFLFKFPFVRGIAISGSLSKNFADEHADIDYFIITCANRLWMARTMMHLYKKLTFLTGRQRWYCMNYYVDEEALLIKEKNIYTAMEIVTLLPENGNDAMEIFFKVNEWTKSYFPNYPRRSPIGKKEKGWKLKVIIERLFNNRVGEMLDDYLMRATMGRWNRKEGKCLLNGKGSRMGLRGGKHFSKPNPGFFQKDLLYAYYNKLRELMYYAYKV